MSIDIHFQCAQPFSGDEKGHQDFSSVSDGNDTSDTEEIISSRDLDLQKVNLAQKCLSKSAELMSYLSFSEEEEEEEKDDLDGDFETALKDIFSDEANSMPLLSAMKGSREKSGASPVKLTVKWAPDVYDPPPTILSNTLARGQKQQKSRKDRKYEKEKEKQKGGGNSSRGAKGKDKKQYRKVAAGSNKCYRSVVNDFDDYGFDLNSPEW